MNTPRSAFASLPLAVLAPADRSTPPGMNPDIGSSRGTRSAGSRRFQSNRDAKAATNQRNSLLPPQRPTSGETTIRSVEEVCALAGQVKSGWLDLICDPGRHPDRTLVPPGRIDPPPAS